MALTVETGDGVAGAESYASVAAFVAHWAARPQSSLSSTAVAASTASQEGALREATAHLDATFGPHYRGVRKGYVQGLLWPRSDALDDAGYPLPDLPPCLVTACMELAARALSAPLADDLDRGGAIKRERVGPIEVEYVDGAPAQKTYGAILGTLAPILNGTQAGGAPQWNWR